MTRVRAENITIEVTSTGEVMLEQPCTWDRLSGKKRGVVTSKISPESAVELRRVIKLLETTTHG